MRIGLRGLAEVAALALSVITTVWVGRAVGPEVFGYYAIAGVIIQVGVLVGGLGLGQAGAMLVARQRAPVGRVVATVLSVRLAAATALAGALALLLVVAPADPRLETVIGASGIAWLAASLRLDWLFVAAGRVGMAALLRLSGPGAGLVVALSAIRGGDDVGAIAALLVAPIAVPAGVGLVAVTRSGLTGIRDLRAARADVLEAVRHGRQFLRGELATLVTTSSDRIFLFVLAGPATLGLYDAAYRVIQPFYSVASVVNDAFYARLAASYVDRHVDRFVFRRYADLSLVATVPLGFLLAVHAEPIMTLLFGPGFAAATPVLALLGWVITLGFVSGVLVYPLTAFGRPRAYADAVGAGGATNLFLNVALIPGFAGIGAAVSTIAAKAAISIIGFRRFRAAADYPIGGDLLAYTGAAGFAIVVSAVVASVAAEGLAIGAFIALYVMALAIVRRASLRDLVVAIESGPRQEAVSSPERSNTSSMSRK